MQVTLGGASWTGPAVDLRGTGVPAAAVAAAVRGEPADPDLSVTCAPPGPVHEHVGVLRSGPSLSLRAALAAAARSRGHRAPQDEALEAVRADLADLPSPDVDLASVRRRVAERGDEEAALRERAAALRGRVAALREVEGRGDGTGDGSAGAAVDDAAGGTADAVVDGRVEGVADGTADAPGTALAEAEAALAETTRRLSEATTERVAAEQALRRARREAREARAVRARRLRLEDRAGNLARAARAHLAGVVHDAFARAVAAVPGAGRAGDRPGKYEGDPLVAALAVVRVADVDAPVVVACDRFPSAVAARACLDAPVVLV